MVSPLVQLVPEWEAPIAEPHIGARLLRPLAGQLPAGRLLELSGLHGCAHTTVAAGIVRQAQLEGETAAWIQRVEGGLYPPDLHDAGVDTHALAVIHVPLHAGAPGPFKAADFLLRSGAFGIVVIDLRRSTGRADIAWQRRLLALAREHRARVVLLTETPTQQGSLGPLVSLRIESRRTRQPRHGFVVEHCLLKNKSGLPLDLSGEPHRGPWGVP